MPHVLEYNDEMNSCKTYLNTDYVVAIREYSCNAKHDRHLIIKIKDGSNVKIAGDDIDVILNKFKEVK